MSMDSSGGGMAPGAACVGRAQLRGVRGVRSCQRDRRCLVPGDGRIRHGYGGGGRMDDKAPSTADLGGVGAGLGSLPGRRRLMGLVRLRPPHQPLPVVGRRVLSVSLRAHRGGAVLARAGAPGRPRPRGLPRRGDSDVGICAADDDVLHPADLLVERCVDPEHDARGGVPDWRRLRPRSVVATGDKPGVPKPVLPQPRCRVGPLPRHGRLLQPGRVLGRHTAHLGRRVLPPHVPADRLRRHAPVEGRPERAHGTRHHPSGRDQGDDARLFLTPCPGSAGRPGPHRLPPGRTGHRNRRRGESRRSSLFGCSTCFVTPSHSPCSLRCWREPTA